MSRDPNRSACSVDGCETLTVARGWCDMHYRRWKKHGSVEEIILPTPEQRFWSYVDKNGPMLNEELGNCWNWTGSLVGVPPVHLYGAILINGVQKKAHRYSLELVGIDPTGFMACHRCDNTRCVNPDHLYLGDAFSNMKDMVERNRQNVGTDGDHHSTRITRIQIEEMKSRREQTGDYYRIIAADYGISFSHARNLILDKRRTPEAREQRKRQRSAAWQDIEE